MSGRFSIFSVGSYRVERSFWVDSLGDYNIILSGRWKSGTRFRYYHFRLTPDEWGEFTSVRRDSVLGRILN